METVSRDRREALEKLDAELSTHKQRQADGTAEA